jgi:hypothetical protein
LFESNDFQELRADEEWLNGFREAVRICARFAFDYFSVNFPTLQQSKLASQVIPKQIY